jgi:hypothetical protein
MDRLVLCGPGTARDGPVHRCYFAAVSGCFQAGTRSAVACDATTRHVDVCSRRMQPLNPKTSCAHSVVAGEDPSSPEAKKPKLMEITLFRSIWACPDRCMPRASVRSCVEEQEKLRRKEFS